MFRLTPLLVVLSLSAFAQDRPPQTKPSGATVQKAHQEMLQMLGVVPAMFKALPDEAVPGAWEDFRDVVLSSKTSIPPKYKELMGLAVSAQVPCTYCTYFHTASAKSHGASQRELTEAIAMAALTRKWSTMLNGQQTDFMAFRKETDKSLRFEGRAGGVGGSPEELTDAQSAYKDMELTFGKVPGYMQRYPASAVAGAYREMKALELNPNTAVPAKYKELIGLGVAAQIPCDYCVYFHTEAAKKNGAGDDEIKEALAVAAMTRHWSTVLNGAQLSLPAFQKETDQILMHVKRPAGKR